jgi:hypothetical protein
MAKKTKKVEKPSDVIAVTWKRGFRMAGAVDAEAAYKEVRQVMSDNGHADMKECTAAEVAEWAAKRPESVLHELIGDWDDKVAANKWRIHNAGVILRSIMIEYREAPGKPTRALEIDTSRWQKDAGHKPYRDTREIMADPDARAALLQRALNELIAFRRKFGRLQELAIVLRAVDEVLETVKS